MADFLSRFPLTAMTLFGSGSVLFAGTQITYFSSESVCAGHPDKVCDQISDAILDEVLKQDPKGKTAVETVVGNDCVALYGEINTSAKIDFETLIRNTIREIGYTNPDWGFSHQPSFQNHLHQQSPEIAIGVMDDEGAGDQGLMFGYACKDTPELMPLPITLSHALTRQLDRTRSDGTVPFIRPDGKSQVTVAYENGKPIGVEKIVIAIAHSEEVDHGALSEAIISKVIAPVLETYQMALPPSDHIIINGTGVWHIPGPYSDAGLTGRKIVVDTYGGYARVGGGAFSGKDPSKVDRSGAYAARYIAKNIVAAGLAERCEVAFAFVIGHARPVMFQIDTFGTANNQKAVEKFAADLIDRSVKSLIETLDLRRPIYKSTAAYGHFGREEFPWEKINADYIDQWKRDHREWLMEPELNSIQNGFSTADSVGQKAVQPDQND